MNNLQPNTPSYWLYNHRLGLAIIMIMLLVGLWLIGSITSPCSVEINSMGA